MNMIDFKMNPQEALDAPPFFAGVMVLNLDVEDHFNPSTIDFIDP